MQNHQFPLINSETETLRILAIETTQRQGSIALLDDESIEFHHTLPADNRSAASLAPEIKAVCARHQWALSSIDLIAVTTGPGSFTGLRVGIVTAKTLGYALDTPVVGINTLDAIALQALSSGSVEVVMDAQRNSIFRRRYTVQQGQLPTPIDEVTIIDDQQWAEELPDGMKVSGPVLAKLKDNLPEHIELEDESLWAPKAISVAKLARHSKPLDSPLELMPNYFRKSAAEEKHDETNT